MTENRNYTNPDSEISEHFIIIEEANRKDNVQSHDISIQCDMNDKSDEIINENVETSLPIEHAVNMSTTQQYSNNDNKYCHKRKHSSDLEDSHCVDIPDNVSMCSTSTYEMFHDMLSIEMNDNKQDEILTFPSSKCSGEETVIKPTSTTYNSDDHLQSLCDTNENVEDPPSAKRRRLSNNMKMETWLNSHYKIYCEANNNGNSEYHLHLPLHGRIAMHSEAFIVSRYREGKNIFFVTPEPPFKIYIGVTTKYSYLSNCINVEKLRFADLNKYPRIVRNFIILLRTATGLNENNFCILRGVTWCWELIGSVTKASDGNHQNNLVPEQILKYTRTCSEEEFEEGGLSKWFVMTIEKEIEELRFLSISAYVGRTFLMRALTAARDAERCCRLFCSRQDRYDTRVPPFGVYAIPNEQKDSFFVGPYEMAETLDIVVKHKTLDGKSLSGVSGYWMTTKTKDNWQVIAEPLAFIETYRLMNRLRSNENDEASKHQQGQPKTVGSYSVADDYDFNVDYNIAKLFVEPTKVINDLNLVQITSQDLFVETPSISVFPVTPTVFSTPNEKPITKCTNHGTGDSILKPKNEINEAVQNKSDKDTLSYSADCTMTDRATDTAGLFGALSEEDVPPGYVRVELNEGVVMNDYYNITDDEDITSDETRNTIVFVCDNVSLDLLLSIQIRTDYVEFFLNNEDFNIIDSKIRSLANDSNYLEGTEVAQWILEVTRTSPEAEREREAKAEIDMDTAEQDTSSSEED